MTRVRVVDREILIIPEAGESFYSVGKLVEEVIVSM